MDCLELFAGVGGMTIGLANAGFRHLQLVEKDPYCVEMLNKNSFFKWCGSNRCLIKAQNVSDMDFTSFEKKLTLLAGGPPCQPFSYGGSHRAATDQRNLFPEAVRAVFEARPKAFVFENVPGIMRQRFQNYFEYLKLSLSYPSLRPKNNEDWEHHLRRLENHHTGGSGVENEYRVFVQALNAADYGVPQRRLRVFFVGIRRDQNINWSFPLPTHSSAILEAAKQSGEYFERHKILWRRQCSVRPIEIGGLPFELGMKPWITLRDAIASLPDPEQHDVPSMIEGHYYKGGARVYKGHTGSQLDYPAKTLKAGVNGVPGGENMMIKDDGSVRYLTVRECARVQTFPDEFRFHPTWSRAVRQLGNAVPVQLAEVIGNSLALAFSHSTKSNAD